MIQKIFSILAFSLMLTSCTSSKPHKVDAAEFTSQLNDPQSASYCQFIGELEGKLFLLRHKMPLLGKDWSEEILFTEKANFTREQWLQVQATIIRRKLLNIALTSDKTPNEIIDAWVKACTSTGGDKQTALEQGISKHNFTYFILALDQNMEKDYHLQFKDAESNARASSLALYFSCHLYFANAGDIQKLNFKMINDDQERGTFSIDNQLMTADFIYYLDRNGISKLLIPHKNSIDEKDALVVFDKQKKEN